MFFLLNRLHNGVRHTLGIVRAKTPEVAARKLDKQIEGHLTKWDGLSAHYLKKSRLDDSDEPLYILEHWAELKSFPGEDRCNHPLGLSENLLVSCRLPKGHKGKHFSP